MFLIGRLSKHHCALVDRHNSVCLLFESERVLVVVAWKAKCFLLGALFFSGTFSGVVAPLVPQMLLLHAQSLVSFHLKDPFH